MKHTSSMAKKLALFMSICIFAIAFATACGGSDNNDSANDVVVDANDVTGNEDVVEPQQDANAIPAGDTPLANVVINVDGDAMLIASSGRYPGATPVLLNDYAVAWHAGSVLYWELEITRPGLYLVSLNYSVDAGQGGTATLEIGGLSASFSTSPTDGDGLARIDVIEANFPAGTHRLTITAQDVNTSLMNLRRVALVKLPDTVVVLPDTHTSLSPANALLHGPDNIGGNYIGNWALGQHVEWALGVEEAGRYEVEITYTTQGGARGVLTGFGRDFEFGLYDGTHTRVVGDIVLNAGNRTLRIEPVDFDGNNFMNLENIVLNRVGAPAVRIYADRTVLLPADAMVAGGAVIQSNDIGGWVQGASAAWPLEVARTGNYAVTVYAAAPDNMGGIVGMNFLNMTHAFEVPATGSWDNYQPIDAGIIGLREGTYDMLLQGLVYNYNWMMNLHQIVLTYVGEFGPTLTVDGETTLPVAGAITLGGAIVENNWQNVGGWRRGYGVEFSLYVVEGGEFDIYMYHAGGGGTGGQGLLYVSGTEIDIYIQDTGDWGRYEENNYGVITLDAGVQTIRIMSIPESNEWFMNLSNIRLVPR